MNVPSPPDGIIPPNFTAPFDGLLGMKFTELDPDGGRAQLEVTPNLLQPMGLVHGGVYCSMIESLASVAAYTWLNASGEVRDSHISRPNLAKLGQPCLC